MTDTDYADDLVIYSNAPASAEFLLHRLEQVAGDTGLFVNTNKIELMYF